MTSLETFERVSNTPMQYVFGQSKINLTSFLDLILMTVEMHLTARYFP